MKRFRRILILAHRYIGLAMSPLFVMWFASGIAMIYARDMPRLTPDVRLQRLAPLTLNQVRISAEQAVQIAMPDQSPDRVTLLMVMERPAYRLTGSRRATIFADTGEPLAELSAVDAVAVAGRFMGLPTDRLRHERLLTTADQWTIGQRREMPLHKVVVDDSKRSELYVSQSSGEVVLWTSRQSRALAWIAAIPHWFYLAPLRVQDALWRQVVLWTSGVGTMLALLGIVLGILQLKPNASGQSQSRRWIPYVGMMRWHHMTGLIFGLVAFTWVFSGLLSMDPWNWSAGNNALNAPLRNAMSGGPLNVGQFGPMDVQQWDAIPHIDSAKEIDWVRIHDAPYYAVTTSDATSLSAGRRLFRARTLEDRRDPFPDEAVLMRLRTAIPDVPVLATEKLQTYDSYYYSRRGDAQLPVIRVKLGDSDATWLYIDPSSSQIVRRVGRRGRVERWLYNGFHSLDYSFWYRSAIWDVVMIVLSLGGLSVSGLGFILGLKRLLRPATSMRRVFQS